MSAPLTVQVEFDVPGGDEPRATVDFVTRLLTDEAIAAARLLNAIDDPATRKLWKRIDQFIADMQQDRAKHLPDVGKPPKKRGKKA